MKRPLRLLALGGALAAASVSLSACDASPYAAKVNGQVITQAALNNQLKAWAGNQPWVASFNSANSQQNGGTGATVHGDGGTSTYSSTFVADILGNQIGFEAVHQHIVATGQLPSPDMENASRAVNQYLRADYWYQFPSALRQVLVDLLADQAPLTPVSGDQATIQGAYNQIQPYLFFRLCMNQASAFNQADAQAIVGSGSVKGAPVCFDQAALENQPQAYRDAVIRLVPGEISSPIPTSFGYVVVQLVSRTGPGLSDGVQRVLSVATSQTDPPAVTTLIQKASVTVNPAYGTWSNGRINTPQLTSS